MDAIAIQGATRSLGAPKDWDREKNGECGYLAIRDDEYAPGVNAMSSAWRPTPEELARLNAGAAVILCILGESHPPVAVAVGGIPSEPSS